MACSGLNEHKEGARKQMVLDRAAHSRRLMMEGLVPKDVMTHRPVYCREEEEPGYMRKMGSPPGIDGPNYFSPSRSYDRDIHHYRPVVGFSGGHNSTAVDRLRRDGLRAQQLVDYSAKIPNRFSSLNYTQQW